MNISYKLITEMHCLDKQLKKRIEETDANIKLLNVCARLVSSGMMSLDLVLGTLVPMKPIINHAVADLDDSTILVPIAPSIKLFDSMFSVRRNGVSGSLSNVFGLGLQTFSSIRAELNKITLVVRDVYGTPADFVVCDDVTIHAFAINGAPLKCEMTITSCVDGVILLHYAMPMVSRAYIRVTVCGIELCDSPWLVLSSWTWMFARNVP